MARKTARPGRTLAVFFLGLAIAFGAGGPDRHLEARARPRPPGRHQIRADAPRATPTTEHLNEAADIIDQRVNGSGVTEAEVNDPEGNRRSSCRSPARAERRPGRDRQAPGPAAVPAGRQVRLRPQPLPAVRPRPHGPDRTPDGSGTGVVAPSATPSGSAGATTRRRRPTAPARPEQEPRAGDATERRRPAAPGDQSPRARPPRRRTRPRHSLRAAPPRPPSAVRHPPARSIPQPSGRPGRLTR